MDEELKNRREAAMAELQNALAELESGTELSGLKAGHGVQSRRFSFSWSEPDLAIDFEMPYSRVLSDEEAQRAENTDIGAAVRLALLLLEAAGRGTLLQEGESSLRVSIAEGGAEYLFLNEEGDLADSGGNLAVLASRLELSAPRDGTAMTIIWP